MDYLIALFSEINNTPYWSVVLSQALHSAQNSGVFVYLDTWLWAGV